MPAAGAVAPCPVIGLQAVSTWCLEQMGCCVIACRMPNHMPELLCWCGTCMTSQYMLPTCAAEQHHKHPKQLLQASHACMSLRSE